MSTAEQADQRYQEALRLLGERGRFGIRLGLSRTRALLRRLGSPERGLPGVLIGGTNGKGSVQALVGAVLRQAGRRVGQTPKPHLVSYRERILIDGEPIGTGEFAMLIERVLAEAEAIERRHGPPTEFEVLTAAAFSWFRQSGVELAVVEVGLGGRLDATNAWQGGLSAITNVALDHTEHLGSTVAAITREKAQIVKRGDHLALSTAEPEALALIAARARRVAVPLRVVQALPVLGMDRAGLRLAAGDSELRVGLLGRHQAANAALALAILEAMDEIGMASVSQEALRTAMAGARWPGRLELLALAPDGSAAGADPRAPDPGRPDVLLDGAHNPHGTAALAAALDELRPQLSGGRPTVLLGVLGDRDVPALLAPLLTSRALIGAQVIATDVPDTPRALPAAQLAQAWRAGAELARSARGPARGPARAVPDVDDALAAASRQALAEGGPLLICGSLYLVGHVRGRLLR